jgi:hypothetical protein
MACKYPRQSLGLEFLHLWRGFLALRGFPRRFSASVWLRRNLRARGSGMRTGTV